SWGRILNITYPDNEEVNYSYDFGGQLERIANNQNYTYLDSIQYNKFGAKTSQLYGNGIKTNYTYYPLTQRLDSLLTTYSGNTLSYLQYTYDSVGNIIRVNSSYPMPQYQVTERYTYDSADQLLTAESTCNNNVLCSGAYSYNNWGKINTYTQQTTDPATNTSENKDYRYYFPSSSADMAQGQTSFAPIIKYDRQQTPQPLETCTYGINGSIRKRVDNQTQNTDYYYFNTSGNLKACGTDMQISVYGYNSANTRTYKVNMFNANQWVNGQPQPIQPMVQSAMFYPNTYINFTQAGEYTKHYYNGTERIASRLGEQQVPVSVENEQELEAYKQDVKQIIYNAIGQHLYDEPTNMQEGEVLHLEYLQPCGNSNAIYYYHPNHLSSTMYVTDMQQSVVQSFLYAPYGEIISEYNTHVMGEAFPKYSFNAKELDEETGMYYYEARYYKPPVFTSRDAMFEKYFWMTPYAYCANNPVKYVDPSGDSIINTHDAALELKRNQFSEARNKLQDIKLTGNKDDIKKAKSNFQNARRDYYNELSSFFIAQKAIDNFKLRMPEEYSQLNSLKDSKGNAINVNVVVTNSNGVNRYGETDVRTMPDGTISRGFISIFLYKDKIEMYGMSPGRIFSHEGGHGFYEVTNSEAYYKYCIKQSQAGTPVTDGHNEGNLSGETAIQWENKYMGKEK
ncbi:MAG: hypothetical protein K6F29_07710, partial [Bacteroidales bacterium]|nr:hypothetical protein [Bacteroidales bacterium]